MKRRYMLVLITIVLTACCMRAEATTWHVSPGVLGGIEDSKQFRTIAEAAAVVKAGDVVSIHTGVYRERITIETDGLAEKPIVFEAAAGANVVITGADLITDWNKVDGPGAVYSTAWPHRFITWNKTGTHPSDDFHLLTGRCEQVFVNGYALRQVLQREKLSRGTFFVDLDGRRLYAWGYDNKPLDGDRARVEASVRGTILTVEGDYVRLKGICFRYAANRAQHGAVEFKGDHLVVSDCVFERVNSSGAAFLGEDIEVRHCRFQNNGQLGFGASGAHRLHMVDCEVRNNNTKGFDRGWEAGGDKICMSRGVVLERSRFVENRGDGIWFDIGNEDCTVRNCLVADNEDAGVFYEISYGLNAHDNVIVGNGLADTPSAWGASAGISLSSSPGCVIERNILIGNKEGFNFREQKRSTPRIDSRGSEDVWNHDNTIRNNIIAFNRDAQTWGWFDVSDNRHWPGDGGEGLSLGKLALTMKGNLYYASAGQGLFNWGVTWKKNRRYKSLEEVRDELGLEQGSVVVEFAVKDFSALDLRVPANSTAVESGCYPKGEVPGVRLGVYAP